MRTWTHFAALVTREKLLASTPTGQAVRRQSNSTFCFYHYAQYNNEYYYNTMSANNDTSGPESEALDPSQLQLARNAPGGITRVMSPRQNEGLLVGLAGTCQRCEDPVHEPIMCTQCGIFGHAVCLGIERFQGYPFCAGCLSGVIVQFAEFQDAVKREQWTRSLQQQIVSWRQRAITAMGVSTAVVELPWAELQLLQLVQLWRWSREQYMGPRLRLCSCSRELIFR